MKRRKYMKSYIIYTRKRWARMQILRVSFTLLFLALY